MTEKVLLVDDEKDFLEVLAERMRARGMDVTTASTASEAVVLVENTSFDAIILDLKMPEMDGIETLKRMKGAQPDVQVILLTGHASVDKAVEAMRFGAVDFMEKPADIDELTQAVKSAQAQKMIIVEKKIEEKMKTIMGVKGW